MLIKPVGIIQLFATQLRQCNTVYTIPLINKTVRTRAMGHFQHKALGSASQGMHSGSSTTDKVFAAVSGSPSCCANAKAKELAVALAQQAQTALVVAEFSAK